MASVKQFNYPVWTMVVREKSGGPTLQEQLFIQLRRLIVNGQLARGARPPASRSMFECKEIRGQCALFGARTPAWAEDGVCSIHVVMIEAEKRAREVMAGHTLSSIAGRRCEGTQGAYGQH